MKGADRARYGAGVFQEISAYFKRSAQKAMDERRLREYVQVYERYPQIWRSLTAKLQLFDNQYFMQLPNEVHEVETLDGITRTDPDKLINCLTYTHLVELLKCDSLLKQVFYETEAIRNSWNVRELRRAMNSMLFERTGLSQDKAAVLERHRTGSGLTPDRSQTGRI